MHALTLPTDNLYKFLALAGLVIMITVPLYTMLKVWNIQTEVAELKARQEHAIPPEYLEGEDLMQEHERLVEQTIRIARIKERSGQIYFLIYISGVSFLVGGAMAMMGFTWWYTRVQKYLDAGLQREIDDTS